MWNKDEKVTLTDVRDMGFSDRLIKELLPEPKLVDNPIYRHGPKMKLWYLKDVKKAMENQAFKDYQIKREKRKLAAKKAVGTKTKKLENKMFEFLKTVEIKYIDLDTLRDITLDEKQKWYDMHFNPCIDDEPKEAYTADEDTVKRWMVNYVRHNLTEYDHQLYLMHGKVGKKDVYEKLHMIILNLIAETYPDLSDECERQIKYMFEKEAEQEFFLSLRGY